MAEFRIKDFYINYRKKGGQLNRATYPKFIRAFLKIVRDDLIENGTELNMGYGVGKFAVARYERSFRRPAPNWGASNKRKKELLAEGKELYNSETKQGHEWMVFFTDRYYYALTWKKDKLETTNRPQVHNIIFYKMDTTYQFVVKLMASIDEMSLVRYREVDKWNTI